LRGDLVRMGEVVASHVRAHADAMRAVLVEVSRNDALNAVMQDQFLDQRRALMEHILGLAVERGEIDATAITDELWDLLPGYLIFRTLLSGRPPSDQTVQALVDNVVMPSLTRRIG
jgi:hypothetical protein